MNPLIIYTLLAGAGAGVGIAVILDSKNEPKPIRLRHDEFLKLIPQIICQYTQSRILNTGTVLRVVDAIARIYGLNEVIAGELIKFEDGTVGISLHLDSQIVGLVLIGDGLFIQEGSSVKATGRTLVNEGYLNHIRNAVIDGRGGIPGSEYRLIESSTPNIISRCSVYEPLLQTGLLIDSMIPIGRGRRKWISGDRQRAKTAVATDTILNQLGKNVRSAYVLIDQKQQAQVLMTFHESKEGGGGLGHSIMVNEPPIIPATYGSKCVYLNSVFVALTVCYHIGWWIRKLWGR